MKLCYFCTAWLVPLCALAQTVSITADRPSALYACEEVAKFTIQALDAEGLPLNSGTLTVAIGNGGATTSLGTTFDLANGNPVQCTGTSHTPDFLQCVASIKLDKIYRGIFGVAYEPEKIQAAAERPADFDAFWEAAIRKHEAEVPIDEKLERLEKYCTEKHECFQVSFATFDSQRVYGFLSIPKGDGPFPVLVRVPGAGPGAVGPDTQLVDKGWMTLIMNVHGYAPGPDAAAQKMNYEAQDKRLSEQYGAPRYCQAGATTRETYFYYRAILGINRSVNWLASRTNADRARFMYGGTSQGGGFGLILCGLNKNFVKATIHVPALTDHLGFQKGRPAGWPKLIQNVKAEDRGAAMQVAPYFDGAHFAPRITCPIRMSVGFVDETCPPASVYAAFNALAVKNKAITHGIAMAHGVFPGIYQELDQQWLMAP